jgi:hypothetical protein
MRVAVAPGADRVDGDVPLSQFGSQIAHHGRDSGLACRVQGVLIDRQTRTDRGTEHDPAAVGHRGDRRLGDEQLSGHVGLDETIEVGLGDGVQRSKCSTPALLTNRSRAPNSDTTAPTSS